MAATVEASAEYIALGGKLEKMPPRVLRSGQARTIAFTTQFLEAGEYFVQLESVYHGMDNEDGKLVPSQDDRIQALEQQVISLR